MGHVHSENRVICLLVYSDMDVPCLAYLQKRVKLLSTEKDLPTDERLSSICVTPRGLLFHVRKDPKLGLLPPARIPEWLSLRERKREPLVSAIQWIPAPPLGDEDLVLQSSAQALFATRKCWKAQEDKGVTFSSPLRAPGSWRKMEASTLSVRAHPYESDFATLDKRGVVAIRRAIIRRGLNSEVRIRWSGLLPHRIVVCPQHKLFW